VLVQERVDIEREFYLGIVIDRAFKGPVIIASASGGMGIEEVAAASSEEIHREGIHPLVGFRAFQGRRLARAIGLPSDLVGPASQIMESLYNIFVENDCSLAEINPLVMTTDGKLLVLDAKLNFEDDALFRHPELEELRGPEQEDALEARAASYGIFYVTLDGDVGCLVNGAGLAMATMDVIRGAGWSPANFLDVGGSASVERVAQAMDIILSGPKVKRVLVNIFGGILRCDIAAEGIVQAYQARGSRTPLVVRMLGTNMAGGKAILAASGLPVTLVDSLAEAAERVGAGE
jgi:succinyl-CoA synthetase beta subunit